MLRTLEFYPFFLVLGRGADLYIANAIKSCFLSIVNREFLLAFLMVICRISHLFHFVLVLIAYFVGREGI